MTWDAWTYLVLGVAVLSAIRPAWATLGQQQARPGAQRSRNLEQAGGGAAMLALAVYLVTEARPVIGRGYWDLAVLAAMHDPFMRALPMVWVPALCWVLLVVFGCWFLFQGIRRSRGSRDPMLAVWAFNEMAIFGVLLCWGAYVPGDWTQAQLVNFGLEGIYISAVVGGFMRLLLVMRGPGGGGAVHPEDQGMQPEGRGWLGRQRRF